MRQLPPAPVNRRRIYPLSPQDLTEEQIAVTFAMTSRRPEPFDEIARGVSAARAANFNERWVLDYGHASVAEHAILHLAVENISRLAGDALEDNRLASYTEKSSRYQVIDPDSFHVPRELDDHPALQQRYVTVCRSLFTTYHDLLKGITSHLKSELPQRADESDRTYALRQRRFATDACRAVLPAATLTNIGLTANARTLEHAISKLMSSSLTEERDIGAELREQGRTITPTLVKYADHNPYLAERRAIADGSGSTARPASQSPVTVSLVDYDRDASRKLVAALRYRRGDAYSDALAAADAMSEAQRRDVIDAAVCSIGPHDPAPREFELVSYTFEFSLDYGAWREFRRHRMQTYLSQPLTVANGYAVPPLIRDAGLSDAFGRAMSAAATLHQILYERQPAIAQYAVTHAHQQRILSQMSLRECYHLFKLRTARQAHESVRQPVTEAMRLAVNAQPELFRHLRLRNAPQWWPFPSETHN